MNSETPLTRMMMIMMIIIWLRQWNICQVQRGFMDSDWLRHLQVRLIYRQRKGPPHSLESKMGRPQKRYKWCTDKHLLLPWTEVNALGIRNQNSPIIFRTHCLSWVILSDVVSFLFTYTDVIAVSSILPDTFIYCLLVSTHETVL